MYNDDFYNNNTNYNGYDSTQSYYDNNLNPGSFSSNITIQPKADTIRGIKLVVGVCVATILIFAMNLKDAVGDTVVLLLVVLFVLCVVSIMLSQMLSITGKKFELHGYTADLTRFYINHEQINQTDIGYAELITGLTKSTRGGTIHYNKLVIHYKNKSIAFEDIYYDGWQQMVDNLDSIGKLRRVDGRNIFRKFIDEKLK